MRLRACRQSTEAQWSRACVLRNCGRATNTSLYLLVLRRRVHLDPRAPDLPISMKALRREPSVLDEVGNGRPRPCFLITVGSGPGGRSIRLAQRRAALGHNVDSPPRTSSAGGAQRQHHPCPVPDSNAGRRACGPDAINLRGVGPADERHLLDLAPGDAAGRHAIDLRKSTGHHQLIAVDDDVTNRGRRHPMCCRRFGRGARCVHPPPPPRWPRPAPGRGSRLLRRADHRRSEAGETCASRTRVPGQKSSVLR